MPRTACSAATPMARGGTPPRTPGTASPGDKWLPPIARKHQSRPVLGETECWPLSAGGKTSKGFHSCVSHPRWPVKDPTRHGQCGGTEPTACVLITRLRKFRNKKWRDGSRKRRHHGKGPADFFIQYFHKTSWIQNKVVNFFIASVGSEHFVFEIA